MEAYNNRLRNLFKNNCPIFEFLDGLQEEQRATEGKILDAFAGKKEAKNKTSVRIQKPLKNLAEDYHNRSPLEFIQGCSFSVRISSFLVTEDEDEFEREESEDDITVSQ